MRPTKFVAIAGFFVLALCTGLARADPALDADLRFTAGLGDAGRVAVLLQQGADPNAPDQFGMTALHYAATSNVDTVKILLSHGANADSTDATGETPLHRCLLYSWTKRFDAKDIAQALLDAGAKVNAMDKSKSTPLAYAKDPQLIALLRAHGGTTAGG